MTYPCGHPRTPENTQSVGVGNGTRCRECRRRISRESYARSNPDPESSRLAYRVRYLPAAIYNARAKLASLEAEAKRYGMLDLIGGGQ